MRMDPLPSGGWAELFDPNLLPYGRRRPLQTKAMELWRSTGKPLTAAAALEAASTTDFDAMIAMETVLITAFVREWSHGPTPHEMAKAGKDVDEALEDVPAADIDAIRNECYKLMPASALSPSGASEGNPFGTTKSSAPSGKAKKSTPRPRSSRPRGSGARSS